MKGYLNACGHSKYSNQYLHLRKGGITFQYIYIYALGFLDCLSG